MLVFGLALVLMMLLRPAASSRAARASRDAGGDDDIHPGTGGSLRCSAHGARRPMAGRAGAVSAPPAHAAMPATMLCFRGITKRFGGLVAVDSVDLAVPRERSPADRAERRGQNDLLQHDRRHLRANRRTKSAFDGSQSSGGAHGTASSFRPDQVTPRGIARTFQNIRLFANMTALENVLIGMHSRLHSTRMGASSACRSVKRKKSAAHQRGGSYSTTSGSAAKAPVTAKNMAYGDQRRLEIARALASEPEAAAAGRADRRHESQRDRADDPLHRPDAARNWI